MRKFFRKASKMLMLALVGAMIGVFGVTLPANPSTSSATVGKDFLLYVNTGTVAVPVWTLIGGQRGASLSRSAEEIDVSHKGSGGWGAKKAGLRSWSLDLDGLILSSDSGIAALEYAFQNGLEVNVKLEYPDKSYNTGWGSVTDFSMEAPHDGEATLKGTISGNGALADRSPDITPLVATMSKASPADKVFAILPTTTTVSGVTDDGAAVTISSGYTYSSGTFTLKSAYLAALAVGVHTYVITTGGGETLTVRITITA